ncbi:MAG: hypothetical protein EOO37_05040 [Cytophagaceae bacterium]|nr:MAG: hypothetical protein EOO37_05040 [Cytophagaceae bacterium]
MKWRKPLLLLFVMGLVASTLVLGLWGGFFYLLFCLKFISLAVEFVAAVAPIWLLKRQVQRDVLDPSGAVQAGMRWWLRTYVGLCVVICWLPWFRPFFIPAVPHDYSWVQYLLAAVITAVLGAGVFALKKRHYAQYQKK